MPESSDTPPAASSDAQSPATPPPAAGAGLPRNVAAAIACIPLIGGIVFLILEKTDKFVRFYAMQSVYLGGIGVGFSIVERIVALCVYRIPIIGWIAILLMSILSMVIGLATLVFWIVTMLKAYKNQEWEIPVIGAMARKQLDSGPAAPV
jgi:uncharacterized membrane protein